MNTQPDSPLLVLALGLVCSAVSYGCHRLMKAIEANEVMPLSADLKGDQGIGIFGRTWPFRDKHQSEFFRRSVWHLLLLMGKWTMGFAAVMSLLYPLIYLGLPNGGS